MQPISELNDPQEQLARFVEQQNMRDAGDDEAMMLDIDYVEMLNTVCRRLAVFGFQNECSGFLKVFQAARRAVRSCERKSTGLQPACTRT